MHPFEGREKNTQKLFDPSRILNERMRILVTNGILLL